MSELTPNLDFTSGEALYVQLYKYIKNEIKTGNLAVMAKLPSKRKFARYLEVSENTIESAYEQLMAEGYIESKARKGYFVCEVEQYHFASENEEPFAEEKQHTEGKCIYHFTHSGVDIRTFPFSVFRKLTNQVLTKDNGEVLMLGHPQGELELRNQIAKYLYKSRGVNCSPSQIILGSGTQYLMKTLLQLLDGSIFAVENPGYHRKLVIFEKGMDNVRDIPLDKDGLILSKLKKSGANIVFVTPSHQFPCGMIMPIARRMQLLKWAKEKPGHYIIEDDYDSEFRYIGKPIPALQGLDKDEKVIYMGTFSKALLPSLRISYMVLPIPLLEIYQEDYFFYAQTVSRTDQEILVKFLQEEYWDKHIQKMRVVYRKKRDILIAAISSYFPPGFEVIGQDSGLHILLRPNNEMNEQQLIMKALEAGIKIYPVSQFGENDGHTVLLGFALLSEEEIYEAIRVLARAWFEL
ncbi:PLP-dependent aminotransferase family protein [Cytobacillus firmus]|uniref:MocR-like pyridoxine biosynthesis transcription factor PdxR n=1 Tax=Cytobacillus firmus TaxID=1399 RepID=UPI001C8E864E|nr:PLP-dependent aminotransferase family protein [Cytobacillus firmus]MBX9976279.1 PLP-dependent aminotransferase family protein [Cytobacillus firmus]